MQFEMDWLAKPEDSSASEELMTRCRMGLSVSGRQLFRYEDLLGEHQVKNAITVSAYPLALWFAANWWRLRWEPNFTPDSAFSLHDWKMSHTLAAAGGGYAWPNLTVVSDGENVQLNLKPSQEDLGPLRYIENLDAWISATDYESGIDQFINRTLKQLHSLGEQTALHELWQTVSEERLAPSTALQRQLEARLGYDPEDAPQPLLALLVQLASAHGEGAVQELASLGHEKAEKTIKEVRQSLTASADTIKLPHKSVRKLMELLTNGKPGHPWEKGRNAASATRKQLGIDKGPLNNKKLAELVESPVQLLESSQISGPPTIGMGEVMRGGRAKVVLGKTHKNARRFMTARLIADGIYAGETGNWLPCTNATTARQKFQRAFAQEFLCPYPDLIEWMNTTSPNDDVLEAAAEHFEVSPLLINTAMVNHGHKPRTELENFFIDTSRAY